MGLFTYLCPNGCAPDPDSRSMQCPDCGEQLRAENVPFYLTDDPFRRDWLNKDLAGKANRRLGSFMQDGTFNDAPHDKHEAAARERHYGIKYIGADASSLQPKQQRAIVKAKERGLC